MSTPHPATGRAPSRDGWPGYLPAARRTCSSAPDCPAASCAPAGAARAAVGRRARCTPAATPRSCSCTRRAAAAPTCRPALPWPAKPRTAGLEGTRRGKTLGRNEERANGLQRAPGRSLGWHLWQRLRKAGPSPAVLGAGNKLSLRSATCRTAPEDCSVSRTRYPGIPCVPGVNLTLRTWVLDWVASLGKSGRCPRSEISPGPDWDPCDRERVGYSRI